MLVKAVLHSLQVYWASVFMLPAKVHRDVDKILRSYLWRGKEEGRDGAKVAWDEVCLPFDESDLTIQDQSSWNIASTMKILWLLLVKSGSLWVAWVEAYILNGRSLLEIDVGVCRSLYFRVILRTRDLLKEHVKMEVGDGRRCRVWLDPWLQGDSIIQQFGDRVIYDASSRGMRGLRISLVWMVNEGGCVFLWN